MDKEYYKGILMMYGIIPVLSALKYLENKEEYEECALIESTLVETEEVTGVKYPRKITTELVREVREHYQNPENLNFYINLVLDDIEDVYGD